MNRNKIVICKKKRNLAELKIFKSEKIPNKKIKMANILNNKFP